MEEIMMALAAIGIVGVGCQWLAWWVKLPAILFLLIAGVIAGPVSGYIRPDELFGDLLFPVVSLGVAVILFEGGLTLRLHEIQETGAVVRNLVTVGALATWLVIAVATHGLTAFGWELSFLFGALVVVTGPTVIMPLLRTVRPNAAVSNILRWEGIVIDPLGALLAVLVFEFIVSGRDHHTFSLFATMILVGGLCGVAGAYLLATILRRHLMPEYLHNVAALSLVLGIYALSNGLQHESGLLAVTVMGIMLANMKDVPIEDILHFKESLSILLISLLFIVLAARIEFDQLAQLGWGAAAVFAVVLLSRPVAVAISTFGSTLSWRERALLAWIAPRGIVAAAVSALFAMRLEDLGFHEASLLVPLTFLVIVGTVILQSATARPLANLLGVSEPEPRGVLIVDANSVARAIARALIENGFSVRLADTHWENIRAARMEGMPVYFGNVVSQHADRHLDLVGIGRLFAMSPRPELNALVCLRYKSEFGADGIFHVQTTAEKAADETRVTAAHLAGNPLFGKDVTLAVLARLLGEGAEIRTTGLTADFGFDDYNRMYHHGPVHLFAITDRGRLKVFTRDTVITPGAGWRIVSMIPARALEQAGVRKVDSGMAARHGVPA